MCVLLLGLYLIGRFRMHYLYLLFSWVMTLHWLSTKQKYSILITAQYFPWCHQINCCQAFVSLATERLSNSIESSSVSEASNLFSSITTSHNLFHKCTGAIHALICHCKSLAILGVLFDLRVLWTQCLAFFVHADVLVAINCSNIKVLGGTWALHWRIESICITLALAGLGLEVVCMVGNACSTEVKQLVREIASHNRLHVFGGSTFMISHSCFPTSGRVFQHGFTSIHCFTKCARLSCAGKVCFSCFDWGRLANY